MKIKILYFLLAVVSPLLLYSQTDTIRIKNPSLEGEPRAGGPFPFLLLGWKDCIVAGAEGETPPDVHPGEFFNVKKKPQHGETYVGLVTRLNETWESISQNLDQKMLEGNCYKVSLFLARSKKYVSKEFRGLVIKPSPPPGSQRKPVILNIYGGVDYCKGDLLAQTDLVKHTEWKKYTFVFQAEADYEFITLEAFYDPEAKKSYKGNILLDHMSHIIAVPCKN